jgi:hypothetical protein
VEEEGKGGKRKKKSRRDGKVDQKKIKLLVFGAGALPPPKFFGLTATVNNWCQWRQKLCTH